MTTDVSGAHAGATCPVCQRAVVPAGQRFCLLTACRVATTGVDATAGTRGVLPRDRRRSANVWGCDACGYRALGERRCPNCDTFMRKLGLGGPCPHCGDPVVVSELLDQEVRPGT